MTGACIIDGIDIATLGALILRDGDNDFISFPSRKEPVFNDWPEEHGIEVSDDDPVYKEKQLTVRYYLKGDQTSFNARLNSFVNLHLQAGNRSVYIREFDTTFQLRFLKASGYRQKNGFTLPGEKSAYIDIDYSMDNPLQFLDPLIVDPVSPRDISTHVEFNGIDLSEYGIIVNSVYPSAMKIAVKDPLATNSAFSNGIIADVGAAPKKGKQTVTVECTMIAADRDNFLTNYNALWNNLSVPIVTIGLTAASLEFDGYYQAMSNFRKHPWTGRAVARFNLDFIANVS